MLYINALKRKGYPGAAQQLKDAKGKDSKQAVVHRLYLCKDSADMSVFEEHNVADVRKRKSTQGLMTSYEIWD